MIIVIETILLIGAISIIITLSVLLNIAEKKIEKAKSYVWERDLYEYKQDDEELFEYVSDQKASEDLLNILEGRKC